jgi:hypothetical protein
VTLFCICGGDADAVAGVSPDGVSVTTLRRLGGALESAARAAPATASAAAAIMANVAAAAKPRVLSSNIRHTLTD